MKNPGHRKMARDFYFALPILLSSVLVIPAQSQEIYPGFAFVNGSWIQRAVGIYDGKTQKWVSADDYYAPLQPGDHISLFDLGGKVAEVNVISPRRPDPSGVSKGWRAPIERWTPSAGSDAYAVALKGSWRTPKDLPQPISLNDPQALQVMRDSLTAHGLHIEIPLLTQAFRQNLDANGASSLLFVSANSDPKTFVDGIAGARYAVSLLQQRLNGKDTTFLLESQISFKPKNQTIDEHEHFYGTADRNRFVAFVDLNGDGVNEILVHIAHAHAFTVDVFTFDGSNVRKVISVDTRTDL